ncbi:hypothetical protein BT96DRAFT_329766 [Gymnopus androsaceus JB14]|uniref:Uncharacterized protein n=1 Tax=Gymnopus androsaceus JB14 TaxID=1447944 RepID=A0A6A4I6L6_9AGAR|nr:hypothetical protein BT96DRAFT_329766 [Gymnopus androsaceus JB14]
MLNSRKWSSSKCPSFTLISTGTLWLCPARQYIFLHNHEADRVNRYYHSTKETCVDGIMSRLEVVNFIQLRGSPASGKTTLINLIQAEIESRDVRVHRFDFWPKEEDLRHNLRRNLEIIQSDAIEQEALTYVLIDEAQGTFNDTILWTKLFKRVADSHPGHFFRIIIACSYGSAMPTAAPFDPEIAPALSDNMRINLRLNPSRLTIQNTPPLGLLFDKDDVDDYISRGVRNRSWPQIDHALRTLIVKWSLGYIALIETMMLLAGTKKNKVRSNEVYSLEEFKKDYPLQDLLNSIVTATQCSRLLPNSLNAADPRVNRVFRYMLKHDCIPYRNSDSLPSELNLADIHYTHRQGLLYMERMKNGQAQFTFSFPLQKVMLQFCLEPPVPDLLEDVSTLYRLVTTVIGKFNPDRLRTPRRVDGSDEASALEALYRHEFYMCLYEYRPRAIVSPEYGTEVGHRPSGRVDFLVHRAESTEEQRSWGIELLRDGDRLAQHAHRFSPDGAYRSMISDGMTEFMIVDFRKTEPTQPHPKYKDLLHAVFSDDYTQVTFFDNNLISGEQLVSSGMVLIGQQTLDSCMISLLHLSALFMQLSISTQHEIEMFDPHQVGIGVLGIMTWVFQVYGIPLIVVSLDICCGIL